MRRRPLLSSITFGLPVVLGALRRAAPVLPGAAPPREGGEASLDIGSDLRVADGGRYLVRRDGTPFFWLGDTAWQLFVKLNQQDARRYLSDRARRGFTVIQAGIITWEGNIPNAGGYPAFDGGDVSHPNEGFFRHVDVVIDLAADLGLHVGLLPVFLGSKSPQWLRDSTTAYGYGRWLGDRYRSRRNIIWILGGDVAGDDGGLLEVWRALARGIAGGVTGREDYSRTLMTYHPCGEPCASSSWFHTDAWLSFDMIETHTNPEKIAPMISADYHLPGAKPTGIGEGWYENSDVAPPAPGGTALNVRREAYWSVLSGGYYTYGNDPIYYFGPGWQDALNAPGARNMTVYKRLLTSLPWWTFSPDQSVFAAGAGAGTTLNTAARSSPRSDLIVYLSGPSTIALDLEGLTGAGTLRARWVDPSTGRAWTIGRFARKGTRSFTTPEGWVDAVLLLQAGPPS